MRRQLTFVVGIIAVAIAGVVYTFASGNEPLLGLDLQGGVSVVLEPTEEATDDELDKAVEIIRNRVDGLGVAEPDISTQGGNVLVQIPGVDDQERALELVGQTAELRFRPVLESIQEPLYQANVELLEGGGEGLEGADGGDDTTDEATGDESDGDGVEEPAVDPLEGIQEQVDRWELTGDVDASETAVLAEYDDDRNILTRFILGPTEVTGDALEGADAQTTGVGGWFVSITFRPGAEGIDLFNELAARCHTRDASCPTQQLAIEIDGEVESAPVVQRDSAVFQPFSRDQVQITGGATGFTRDEAEDLALVLDYGALPLEFVPQETRVVSSTLGDDALDAGVTAGIIGLVLVSVYLLAYYRLMGLVAIMSLAVSGALLWTIIAWLGESEGLALTLAGVTGLIVSIGVSVDSNVVYFEHLKEDVRGGRTVRSAVDRAFPIAYSTIVKADVASLIAAVVLYFLTVGQVRGFALFLGLATVLDLVATYFFMGPAIRLLASRSGLYENPSRFGIPTPTEAVAG